MAGEARVRFWQPVSEAGTDLVAAYLEASEGPSHVHEEWQFGVLETASKLSLGAFSRCNASPEDVTIVPPYQVHSERGIAGEAPKWRMLYVTAAMVNQVYGRGAPRVRRPVVTDPVAAAELRDLLWRSGDGSLADVGQWLNRFLERHAEGAAVSQRASTVERARAYLEQHPTQPVTLMEMGAIVGVTPAHLVRSFSRVVGLPPQSYHAQVRLARARRLLAEGKPATWVAYECGFADQSHLSRRFKECHGVTPGVFQTQYLTRLDSLAMAESTAA